MQSGLTFGTVTYATQSMKDHRSATKKISSSHVFQIIFLMKLKQFFYVNRKFLIIMKDKGPNVFKLVKTNSAFDFLKNNTSLVSASEGIISDKIQGIVF